MGGIKGPRGIKEEVKGHMLGNSYGDYPKENTNGQGRTKECLWSGLASSHSWVCGGDLCKQASKARLHRSVSRQ